MRTESKQQRHGGVSCSSRVMLAVVLAILVTFATPRAAHAEPSSFFTYISGNGGLLTNTRESNALVSSLKWDMTANDTLPTEGITIPWRRLAGYKAYNTDGRNVLVAKPGEKLEYALERVGYYGELDGLQSYTVDQLKTISKELSNQGTRGAHYQEFLKYAQRGAIWKEFTLTDGKTLQVRLVGINHDTLSAAVSGYGQKAGLTFMATHVLSALRRMNTSGTNLGGWASSDLRKALNPAGLDDTITTDGEVWSLLPAELKNNIVAVSKESTEGNASMVLTSSANKLWIPSLAEMSLAYSYAPIAEGTAYAYWSHAGAGQQYTLNRTSSTGAVSWSLGNDKWLRSPSLQNTTHFIYMRAGSPVNVYTYSASSSQNLLLGFCI